MAIVLTEEGIRTHKKNTILSILYFYPDGRPRGLLYGDMARPVSFDMYQGLLAELEKENRVVVERKVKGKDLLSDTIRAVKPKKAQPFFSSVSRLLKKLVP